LSGPEADLAVVTTDLAGIVVEVNETAERLFGYGHTEAIGVSIRELIVPERLHDAFDATLVRYRAHPTELRLDTQFEVPVRCRDGEEVLVALTLTRTADRYTATMRKMNGPSPVPLELFLSAERYRLLFDRLPLIVAVVGPDDEVQWSSPSTIDFVPDVTARPLQELIEMIVHPADRPQVGKLLRGTHEEPVEIRALGSDGVWHALSVVGHDMLTEPAVHGIAVCAFDVTRAHDAEQRHRLAAARLTALIESLHVGVLLQDEQQRVVLTNSAFVEMFALGLSPDRLRGSAPAGTTPFVHAYADSKAAEKRTTEAVRRGRPILGDEVVLGNGRVLERDYLPITMDGTTLGHLWVFHDITAQAEIRRSLEQRNRMLIELSALKTEFVRVASHELRTPLTSIATFADLLDVPPSDNILGAEEGRAAVSAIRRNADRMLLLVEDLLLLAKLESGEQPIAAEPVDIAALIREACADAHPPVCVDELPAGPPVVGDERLLRQAFCAAVNVVAAAAEPDRPDAVSATATVDDGGWTVVFATPTNEPASAERLLSTRVPHPDAVGEHRTGALAIMLAREIVARHLGSLTTSADPTGIAVTLTL
jgi:PAS domain S-box-containing protein